VKLAAVGAGAFVAGGICGVLGVFVLAGQWIKRRGRR